LIVSGPTAIRSAIVAAGILCTAGLINSVAAAPLIPGTISVASTGIAETMQVRWRGHGGGGAGLATGLMTGLIIGGLAAAPHYYEEPYPYYHPYYGGYYAPRYIGPIGYGARLGGLSPFTATVRLIPSAEHIWVTTVAGTIVDSSENFARDIQR
jgi:hypothetical protein